MGRPSARHIRRSQRAPDFGSLAARYDQLRPADESWYELLDAIWQEGDLAGRGVLDVGCGTGRLALALAERGAQMWGIDSSEEMLAQAAERCGPLVSLTPGRAESLPFAESTFERAVLRLVVHLVDRPRAFPELARVLVPFGRAVIVTFRPEHVERFWLNPYFPSIREIDRARFPDPAVLAQELSEAGFRAVRDRKVTQQRQVARDEALERIRGRYISTLQLLPPGEFEAGIARAEAELPDEVAYELRWSILIAER